MTHKLRYFTQYLSHITRKFIGCLKILFWAIKAGMPIKLNKDLIHWFEPVSFSHYKQCTPYNIIINGDWWMIPHDQLDSIEGIERRTKKGGIG